MKTRLLALKSTGLSSGEIADRLHEEGFRPAKSPRITAEVVRIWLSRHGLCKDRKQLGIELTTDEWTIPQIVDSYRIAASTRIRLDPPRKHQSPSTQWCRRPLDRASNPGRT